MRSSRVVEADNLRANRYPRGAPPGNARRQWPPGARTDRVRHEAPRSTSGSASAICSRIPAAAVLLFENHDVAGLIETGVATRVVQQHESEQGGRFRRRLGTGQHSDQAPQADRLGAEIGPHQRPAAGGGVAFVENQIDDGQHGVQPFAPCPWSRARHTECRRRESCAWRAPAAAPWWRGGTRNARAISSVSRPHRVRRVSATCASGASAGWQQVKIRRRRSSGISLVS